MNEAGRECMRLVLLLLVTSMLGLACSLNRVPRSTALRRFVEPRAYATASTDGVRWQKIQNWLSPKPNKTAVPTAHEDAQYEKAKRRISRAIRSGWSEKPMMLDLVHYGDVWATKYKLRDERIAELVNRDSFRIVEGCTSSVAIGVARPKALKRYIILGKSDSRVIQGLLAIICDILSTCSRKEIVSLKPRRFITELGVQKILPPGRLDGVSNVVSTIQKLVQKRLPLSPPIISTTALPAKLALAEAAVAASIPESEFDKRRAEMVAERREEVAMLLSGGVDSAVALKLLVDQGYKVRAYYLKIWLEEGLESLADCPWETDVKYAVETCKKLGVPIEVLSMQEEYRQRVIKYTVSECERGRTPNSDIMCNSFIKFGAFYDVVGRFHKKIATGHYAKVISYKDETGNETFRLAPAPDPVKDQSYFLANLSPKQLSHCLFPLHSLHKSEVRQLAEEFDLPPKSRKDSQGLCFLGKLSFDDFIRHYLGERPGDILDVATNEKVGVHRGLWFHTIGQRKGIVPLLTKNCHAGPFFVADKHTPSNTLFITNQPELLQEPRRRFSASRINWLAPVPEDLSAGKRIKVMVKLRHGTTITPATIRFQENSTQVLEFVLDDADTMGIAPGQFAVVYDQDFTHVLAAAVTMYQPWCSPPPASTKTTTTV